MNSAHYSVLGVMSGTSGDGVDLALVELIKDSKKWHYQLQKMATIPYPKKWDEILGKIDRLPLSEIVELDKKYTCFLGNLISTFLDRENIKELDFICSHGHTVFHNPQNHYTFQIGNLPELAEITRHKVICDFRVEDVQLGGQGAPLVPIGDRLLFPEYVACINLGGFANISFEKDKKRIAYDICPVNILLNTWAEKLGKPFDKDGKEARKGKRNETLLQTLNGLPFYQIPPPKSLGIEWVRKNIFPIIPTDINPQDILATFTSHISRQIGNALSALPNGEVLFTGGGTYNRFLMEILQKHLKQKIIIPEPALINYKEALIFGLLGVLKVRGAVNTLSSVTGAAHDHSAGVIFEPTNS